jgi:tetratricopeptide (TPR) repeat protein
MTTTRLKILLLIAILHIACIDYPAQSADKSDKKGVTISDDKIYQEAMVWFKKAEEMIGTPKEYSDEQAALFLKSLQIKPDFLEAHYDLGLIYAHQKKMKEAAEEFEKVLKIEPKFDAGIYMLLAVAYKELGENKAAMAALEAGLQRKPKDPIMLKPLAYLQIQSNANAAAIQTLQQLLEIDPADVASRIDLALLLQKNGESEKAIRSYREALNADPANFVVHYNLGLIYGRQKKNSESAKELEIANQIQPGDPELLELLGDVYTNQKQHEKAAAVYNATLEKAKDKDIVYAKLGLSLAKQDQITAAADALESSVHLNPNNPDALSLLGDLYIDLKRNDAAIAAYLKSIALNPKQKDVHYNLGTLYAEQNRLDDGMAELRITVQLDQNYASAWSNLALVAEKLNLDKEAIQAHETVIALGKAQPLNYFHLGVLYAAENKPDPAIEAFTRAIELEPEKYRSILREELKQVHSKLDSVRYKEKFVHLLAYPSTK